MRRPIPLARGRRARVSSRRTASTSSPATVPVYKLFVVGHGARESIEVFRVDTAPAMPAVTWIGCVIAPDPIGLNSVRGLPDGASSPRTSCRAAARARPRSACWAASATASSGNGIRRAAGRRCPAARPPAPTASSSRTTARRCMSRPGAANRSSVCRAARRLPSATRSRSASVSTTSIGRATARCTR